MICLEVWVNGEKVCLAGTGTGKAVLNSIIDLNSIGPQGAEKYINLHVGALVRNEYLRWTEKRHALQVGDVVTLKIVEADTVDEPIRKHTAEEELQD
jgi:hypothetical protein